MPHRLGKRRQNRTKKKRAQCASIEYTLDERERARAHLDSPKSNFVGFFFFFLFCLCSAPLLFSVCFFPLVFLTLKRISVDKGDFFGFPRLIGIESLMILTRERERL